jgi:hypothetical protein
MAASLDLSMLPGGLFVCRLEPGTRVPDEVFDSRPLASVTHTDDEVAVVCDAEHAPRGARREGPWAVLRVAGPLDFSTVGILSALTSALAGAGVSVFAVSTFDTDYLLVPAGDEERAAGALTSAGHRVAR